MGRPPHALRRRHERRAAAPGVAPRDVLEAHPRNALQGERLAYAAHWFATGCVSVGVYPAAMYRSASQRPSLIDNATRELAPPAPAESRVSVQVHPGPVKAVLGEIEEAQREQEGREEPEDSER